MNFKKFFLSLVITFVILAIVMTGITFFSATGGFKGVLDKVSDGTTNILVVGVDNDGTRSDTIMLLSVTPKDNTINIISIPRDTRVSLKKGYHTKINSCIGKDNGEQLLIDNVKELTGLPVHSFCKVGFEGVRNIIDILGSVEYDVPMDMDYEDPVQDLVIHLKAGPQTLDGAQAEGLLRFRSGYPSADLGRISTQQDFIKEAAKQKLNAKYIFKIFPIMSEISESLDTDLSPMEIIKLAWKFRDTKNLKIDSYLLPGEAKTIGSRAYYVADEDAAQQISMMFETVPTGEDGVSPDTLSDKVID